VPRRSSNWPIWRLTAEGVRFKSRAAAENPPFSTTAANMIICVAISINLYPIKFCPFVRESHKPCAIRGDYR